MKHGVRLKHFSMSGVTVAVLIFGGTPLLAQQTDPSALPHGPDEIIVTAQRREERLQDVPIAVTAVGARELQNRRVTELAEIGKMVPGLFLQSSDVTRPTTYIRGVGNRQFDAGSEGSVGFFFDDFYLGRTSGQLAGLFDLERIEVLRGPQGALFGRNTLGGAVSMISARPAATPGGYVQADVGNYDLMRVEGAVTGPIDQQGRVTGRLSFLVNQRDGFFRNLTTGRRLQADNTAAIRGKLRIEATDALTVNLTGEYNHTDGRGVFFTRTDPLLAAYPGYTMPLDTRPREEALNQDSWLDRKVYTALARVEWETNGLDLVSISGYRGIRSRHEFDFDGSPYDTFRERELERSNAYSEEVRLQSRPGGIATFDDRAEWLLGGIFYKEDTVRTDHFIFGKDSAIASIAETFDRIGIVAPLVPGINSYDAPFANDISTTSVAVYGQMKWKFTDRLNVTAAIRWTRDKKDATISMVAPLPGLPPAPQSFAVNMTPSWSSVDGKLTADYKIAEDVLIFATFAKGSKSGGFQYATFDPLTSSVVFGPEKLYSYEAGLKSSLFDRKLTFNLTGFYYDYSDQQLLGSVPTSGDIFVVAIANAGSSNIKGGEAEIKFNPARGLNLAVAYAYLDARYNHFLFAPGVDNSGNRMPRAPQHTVNIAADYGTDLGFGQAFIHVDWNYQSKFYFEFDEGRTPYSTQNGFGLLNAQLGYTIDAWRVALWGKNLTDTTYTDFEVNLGQTVRTLGSPRTYGVSLGYRF